MKSRLYLETTIPSYLTSRPSRDLIIAGHQELTREWWEKRNDTFELYISQLVVDEASAGDPFAARERLKALQDLNTVAASCRIALARTYKSPRVLRGRAFPSLSSWGPHFVEYRTVSS